MINFIPNHYLFAGAPKAAKIGSGDATVQRVNAEAGNAHALLLGVNVIQMFVEIVGLGNDHVPLYVFLIVAGYIIVSHFVQLRGWFIR